jgi:4-amino-4-deoxy-L-arabinose transferase-like glycosyltransferase
MTGGGGAAKRPGFGVRVLLHVLAAAAVVGVLLPGLRDVPLARDEAVYADVARNVRGWLRALVSDPGEAVSDAGVRRGWEFNHEHPALPRLLAAASSMLFGGWVDPLVALRAGNVLLAILVVLDAFHFLLRRWGGAAAAFGAVAMLLIPCLYGHACIAAMDFPAAALSLLATTAFARGTERPRWALFFGVWMGLALNCKINAAFVPVPLLAWGLAYRRRECAGNLFGLLLVAPLVWIATWPWLWHQTLDRLIEYFQFHREHLQANAVYFGDLYLRAKGQAPPATYPIVYFLLSIPVSILAPAAFATLSGVADAVRRRGQPETVLLVAAMLMPVVVASLPGVPRYDGQRLFLNAFPFAACLAGVGFGRAVAPLAERLLPAAPLAATAAAAALLLLPAAISSWRVHPFEPYSYYNALVGGPSGALRRGLSPLVWAMSDRSVARYLNEHGAAGDVIFGGTGAVGPLVGYQKLGVLRRGFRWGRRPDWIVLEYNLAYSNWPDWWPCYEDRHPWYRKVYEVEAAGAPVLGVFRARERMWRDPSGNVPRTTVRPPARGRIKTSEPTDEP